MRTTNKILLLSAAALAAACFWAFFHFGGADEVDVQEDGPAVGEHAKARTASARKARPRQADEEEMEEEESESEEEESSSEESAPLTEEEKLANEEEALVDAFDALTDKWMEIGDKTVSMDDVKNFTEHFRRVPKSRKEECLQRALNLLPDDNIMLLVGILMDKSFGSEILETVYNDILNRDEDVKQPILKEIFKDKEHPCWADTAWILDVTDSLPANKTE